MIPELHDALQAAGLLATFEALPPSHQREYLDWIKQAKQPATRERRIAKTVEMLRG